MLELLQTIFAGLTFVVFAITATIAVVQLRHMRLSYQMTNASSLLETYWTPQFQSWLHFVIYDLSQRLEDPTYREELRRVPADKTRHPEIYVCEYYSIVGAYVKNDLMPREIFLANGSADAVRAWDRLTDPVRLMREADDALLYRDFEDLAALCRDWLAKHSTRKTQSMASS